MKRLDNKVAIVTGASKRNRSGALQKPSARKARRVVVNYAPRSCRRGTGGARNHWQRRTSHRRARRRGAEVRRATPRRGGEKKSLRPPGCAREQRGASSRFAPFEQFSEQEFHRQFNTNVLGMFLMIEAAFAGLRCGRRQHYQHRIDGECRCRPDPFDLRGVKERCRWL